MRLDQDFGDFSVYAAPPTIGGPPKTARPMQIRSKVTSPSLFSDFFLFFCCVLFAFQLAQRAIVGRRNFLHSIMCAHGGTENRI